MKIAVYPGSFDPVTNGHLDIIRRAAQIFDKVIVAVSVNSQKKPLFTIEERMKLLKFVTKEIAHVEVSTFNGLLANFVEENHAKVIIKGLRAVSDFEYEFQIATTNKRLQPNIETVFLMTRAENMFLSSSTTKEVARFGGDVSSFVPEFVQEALKKKFNK